MNEVNEVKDFWGYRETGIWKEVIGRVLFLMPPKKAH